MMQAAQFNLRVSKIGTIDIHSIFFWTTFDTRLRAMFCKLIG